MSEDQIERLAERKLDMIDEKYFAGLLTEEEYDRAVEQLNSYVNSLYKNVE